MAFKREEEAEIALTGTATMTGSKSSQKTRNVVIAILALWSIISLIIIVVWATSPDLKGASQCRAELRELNEEYQKARETWIKNQQALEVQIQQGWDNQSVLQSHINLLKQQLQQLNLSLADCQQDNLMLHDNITMLEMEIEEQKLIQGNLTAEIAQQKDHIELLEHNVTRTALDLEGCRAEHIAAVSLQRAAEKGSEACQTDRQYLQKQLNKCEISKSDNPQLAAGKGDKDNGASGLQRSTTATILLVLLAPLLISCK